MDSHEVALVRRFNRTVSQRIGALNDRFMTRSRPLGEARVLWEIGVEGTDVRSLRARLDLDAGYLSRLLRSLERAGMAVVEPDRVDRRVRNVRLTEAGLAERAILDQLSDRHAASFLEPLNESQRTRLIDALGVVERLLTAGLVRIDVADPTSAAAQYCVNAYFSELNTRFDNGFDPGRSTRVDAAELTEPAGLLLLAWLREEPIGCGGLKFHPTEPAEIKRMWVAPSARGLGVGRRMLAELEQRARMRAARIVRLETNRTLAEAISLYRKAGYHEVAPFNNEPYAHHWFEKRLDA
jgi:DNA-binding MarR family transcriptional regulator/GNAT superfamily N-acetyltransferase